MENIKDKVFNYFVKNADFKELVNLYIEIVADGRNKLIDLYNEHYNSLYLENRISYMSCLPYYLQNYDINVWDFINNVKNDNFDYNHRYIKLYNGCLTSYNDFYLIFEEDETELYNKVKNEIKKELFEGVQND